MGRRFTEGLIGMTGEALFFFPLLTRALRTRRQVCTPATPRTSSTPFRRATAMFRRVLRVGRDRVVLERARCSEHEVIRDVPVGVAESRVWGSEPGRGLRAAFNRSWL